MLLITYVPTFFAFPAGQSTHAAYGMKTHNAEVVSPFTPKIIALKFTCVTEEFPLQLFGIVIVPVVIPTDDDSPMQVGPVVKTW